MAEPTSYIDYDAFLSPAFSPTSFANSLVTATNNASDTPIDLSTPLSRVLFDVQEIDTNIHSVTTKSALPLLSHTQSQSSASSTILASVEAQLASLTDSYKQLEAEVLSRHAVAEEVRLAVSRLWVTVKIGRATHRALLLGRQLEAQMADLRPPGAVPNSATVRSSPKDDHKAMPRAAYSVLALRSLLAAAGPQQEGEHLARINVINTLRTDLLSPSETRLRAKAQQVIREFSLSSSPSSSSASPASGTRPTASAAPVSSSTPTYVQSTEAKARTTSACLALYLLAPPSASDPAPALLIPALQTYLQAALTASLASLARALASVPTLPRALGEVSARCQSIVGLEALLAAIAAPDVGGAKQPRLEDGEATAADKSDTPANLLEPMLASLDTRSLPSYFWRSLAAGLSPKVEEIIQRGGVPARNLRKEKERVREMIREAVLRTGLAEGEKRASSQQGNWEREAGVMVGSVVRPLGR